MRSPLAVIGMACRLPGGTDTPAQFWELLKNGKDVIGDLPDDRWDVHAWHHPDPARPGKSYASKGGFRENLDLFDADFFGISPREAGRMDPQQRMLLEMAWEALEDAGQVPETLAGTDGAVIFGLSSLDYQILQLLDPESIDAYSNLGCAASIAANRVSHFFDFRGPSYILDTACSSSLVALDSACEAIWSGRSHIAITGAVNLLLSPFQWVGFSKAQMLSRQGCCRVFDAAADGYVRSEGGGVLVLKPLDSAQADGDPVRAVILASATNSDGRTQGLFVPSAKAQEALLREVYERAGVAPTQVAYVEAHGTGTAIGDPTECEALGAALGCSRREPLLVGSVKTNVGHLEAASGMAGAIKVILSLQHRNVPASLHFETPNPRIPFAEKNLAVVTRHTSLNGHSGPLIMGVNSFGFGGANAHVVFKEYGARVAHDSEDSPSEHRSLPLFLSARSAEALVATAANHARYLASRLRPPLYDTCYTAAVRRGHHEHRLSVFGRSAEELAAKLGAFAEGQEAGGLVNGIVLSKGVEPVFVYSGNGSQWTGMGRDLMLESPIFRATVGRVDREFSKLADWSLSEALLDPDGDRRMRRTEVAQPLLFAVQAGLTELLAAYGLSPQAVTGHSVGEVAAAWAAGIYSLEQAVQVICARSRAQAHTAGRGKMAACGLSFEQAVAAVSNYGGALEVASINSPGATTISGDAAALTDLGLHLERQGVFFRVLEIDYPFHSQLMDGAGELLLKGLGSLRPGSSRIRFVSTVTGGALHGEEMGADYWWNNVRRPVLFGKALELLIRDGHALFVEVGPHPVLNTYIRQCLAAENVTGRAVQTLRRRQPEMPQVLSAIGRCYAAGCDLNLQSLFPMAVPPVSLPFYPWQRERHWNGGVFGAPGPQRGEFQHPLLGYRSASADPLWENEIDITELSYLGDHRVLGATLFPVAGFVEMALRAAQLARGGQAVTIENLNVHTPLTLTDNHSVRIQFSVCSEDGSFRIQSCGEDRSVWSLSASGRLGDAVGYKRPEPVLLDELRSRLPKRVTGAEFYRECEHRGLQYGPAFRRLEEVWAGANEALGQLSTGPEDSQNDYCLHPAVLDACLHLSVASVGADADQDEASYLGSQIRRFRLMVDGRKAAYCHARVERRSERSIVLNVLILDADGGVVAEAEGLRAVRVETTAVRSSALPVLEVRTLLQPAGTNGGGPAVALPEPDAIVQALASRPAPSVDEADPSHVRAWADEVCGLFAWEALEALGQDRKAAVPDQFALFDRLVEMAIEDGFPVRKTDAAVVTGDRPVWRAVEVWRRGVADFPAYLAECAILGLRGSALPHLLRGEAGPITENAVRIGASAIEHLFDQAPPARVAYSTVRGVMEEVVRQWPENELLRVLEIGGDGGPLAPHILPLLPSERTQYWFTHASETVRDRTAARLAGFSFARCGALDIMRELAGQAFEERGFDVVVAAGAFQEVSRAAETLPRVRELIRGGGLLVLVEPKPQRFFDIALGPQRLLSRRQWIGHLEESGFERVTTLGEPQDGVAALSVIVARNAPTGAQEIVKAAAPATKRTWIVLREETPEDEAAELPAHCAERLEQAGHRVIQLLPGTAYDRRGENLIVVPWNDADCVRRLFADLSAEGGHCDELIHGWGLTRKLPENADELMSLTSRRCVSALSLVQGLMRAELPHLPRLWLLTCGAMPVAPRAGGLCPAQSSLWGLGRVLAQETPALACKLVDLHWKNNPAGVLDRLLTELDETGAEDEILLTESARYVQRVYSTSIGRSAAASRVLEGEAACRLSLVKPGSADNLVLEGCARPAPDRGQVEIRVRAAGLNFHDLMWAMKLLPDEAVETGLAGPTLGMECAGEVVRVGDGVSEFRTGDAVIAGAPQCFGTHVLAAAAHTLPKPSGVSHEAAATVLTAFTTVVYALEHLGRLQPGERVLIHGAAGGVGLAAIQYAMHVGAEVIATAGTGEKREFLRLLGVPHVFSSRTPDYAEEILQATHGEGVDLVLNTLSGEAVPRSFSVLRPFGRFLELGKRDFIEHKRMAMAPFRNNLSYFGIDLDQAMAVRPGLRGTILPRVVELMSQGVLRPLPFRSFPASRAREAFRHMQKSQHIGKIVISFDDEDMRAVPAEGAILPLRPDGTYLITGGLSGLGLETARWMARKGARNLVLVGRSGAAAPEAAAAVEEIEANGCVVLAASADVADEGALRQLLVQVSERMPPLRGVVHAAMVLDDTLAPLMTAERFWHAARPKIPGAWNLHCLTIDSPLDFFVLYSSAATTLGTPGQANYVAGNLFLESLAQYRRSLGLVGTAISWGAISDTGYLARNTAVRETLENRLAVRPLSARQALRYLEQILVRDCANWIAADVNWRKLASTSPALVRSPRFGLLVGDETGAPSAEAVEDVRARLLALSPDEVRQAVSEILLNELARVVGGSAARIDPERPLAELGVDSLMAVELLTSIESRFHVQLSPLEIMGGGTLSQVARLIAGAVTAETVAQGEQASASVEAGLTAGRVSDP